MKSTSESVKEKENTLLRLLLSAVTHDVVGPLGFCSNVLGACVTNPDKEIINDISVMLRNSYDKAQNILSLMRILSGGEGLPMESVSVKDTLTEKIKNTRMVHPHSTFLYEDTGKDAVVYTCPAALDTALENILTNAAKYTPQGEVIRVGADVLSTHTSIYVKAPTKEACEDTINILNGTDEIVRDKRVSIGIKISKSLMDMSHASLHFSYEEGCFISRMDIPSRK